MNTLMKTVVFSLIVFLTACKNEIKVEGFWIGVDEDGKWNQEVIEITQDSIFMFNPYGLPLKSTYTLDGSEMKIGTTYQLFSNELYDSGGVVSLKIVDNTLIWKNQDLSFNYVRSEFSSCVEHYANSQSVSIDLPINNHFQSIHLSSYSMIDLFIGFDGNGKVRMIMNDEYIDSYDDLTTILSTKKDELEIRRIFLRVFADKSIDMEPLQKLHEAMRQTNVGLIQYVSKPSKRVNKNLSENPYSSHFYGYSMFIDTPPIRIIEDQ